MEWLLFAGLIVGNFLTFGTIKVVKDNKTKEFSLGKVVKILKEKLPDSKVLNPIDENKLLEQQAREEVDDLLTPYDHAIRNIKQDIALLEQENTKKQELMELEERRKEIEEQGIRLSKAMSQAGVSLEEIVEGVERETIVAGINGKSVHTHVPIGNPSMIRTRERKILEGLEDIKERILREDKKSNSDVAIRLSQDYESLQKIVKHYKPFTVKFEIATSLLYIILSELSYYQIVTGTTLGTHESISHATNLDIKTVLEYISVTELRNELRRHKFSTDNKTDNSIIRIHHI